MKTFMFLDLLCEYLQHDQIIRLLGKVRQLIKNAINVWEFNKILSSLIYILSFVLERYYYKCNTNPKAERIKGKIKISIF